MHANINQKECNMAVLLVNLHVVGQGMIQKLSYRGGGGGEGPSLAYVLVVLCLRFTECSN